MIATVSTFKNLWRKTMSAGVIHCIIDEAILIPGEQLYPLVPMWPTYLTAVIQRTAIVGEIYSEAATGKCQRRISDNPLIHSNRRTTILPYTRSSTHCQMDSIGGAHRATVNGTDFRLFIILHWGKTVPPIGRERVEKGQMGGKMQAKANVRLQRSMFCIRT